MVVLGQWLLGWVGIFRKYQVWVWCGGQKKVVWQVARGRSKVDGSGGNCKQFITVFMYFFFTCNSRLEGQNVRLIGRNVLRERVLARPDRRSAKGSCQGQAQRASGGALLMDGSPGTPSHLRHSLPHAVLVVIPCVGGDVASS